MQSNNPQDSLRKIERWNLTFRLVELTILSLILAATLTLLYHSTVAVDEHRERTERNIIQHRLHNQADHDSIKMLVCDIVLSLPPERITDGQRKACEGISPKALNQWTS